MTQKKAAPTQMKAANAVPNTPLNVRRRGGNRKPDGKQIADLVYGPVEPRAGKQLELEFDPKRPITRVQVQFIPALAAHFVARLAAHLIAEENPVALSGYAHGKREADR